MHCGTRTFPVTPSGLVSDLFKTLPHFDCVTQIAICLWIAIRQGLEDNLREAKDRGEERPKIQSPAGQGSSVMFLTVARIQCKRCNYVLT